MCHALIVQQKYVAGEGILFGWDDKALTQEPGLIGSEGGLMPDHLLGMIQYVISTGSRIKDELLNKATSSEAIRSRLASEPSVYVLCIVMTIQIWAAWERYS